MALHKKSLFWDFSVQPLCPLCLCGVVLLGIHQPQRHRGHRGCTEKSAIETFCAKPISECLRRNFVQISSWCISHFVLSVNPETLSRLYLASWHRRDHA